MARSITQQGIENERFLLAFGRRWRRIRTIGRVEHAGLRRALGFGIGGCCRCCCRRRRLCRRRQVERTLAATAAERERGCAQHNDGPSRAGQAVMTGHDEFPNALERDDDSSNRHLALSFCLSMIFSENRYPLFRTMLGHHHTNIALLWREVNTYEIAAKFLASA